MTTGVLLVVNFHYHCGSPSICQDTVADDTTGCQRPAGPGHLKTGPLDHAVPCCGFIVFFPFLFHPPASHCFRFRLPTKQTLLLWTIPRSFPSQRVSKALACKVWNLSFFEILVKPCTTEDGNTEACSAHHRRICGSLQEQTSETGHWHRSSATRRKVGKCWNFRTIVDDLHLAT